MICCDHVVMLCWSPDWYFDCETLRRGAYSGDVPADASQRIGTTTRDDDRYVSCPSFYRHLKKHLILKEHEKTWKNMKEHERTLNSERNCVYKALSWGTDMNWFSRFHAKAESEQLGWHQDAADRTFLEAWQSMTESMTKWTIKNSWEILNN